MGSTVSPDGRFLAATSTDKKVVLQVFDLNSYKQVWSVGNTTGVNQRLADGTVGQEGPTYSPDGHTLWLPEQDAVTKFSVNADGTLGAPMTFALPKVGTHSALVGQLAYSPDGTTVYAALNGQNSVVALDPNSGAVKQTWNVGIAPRELKFAGSKLYVSDEGGRQAKPGEATMDSYGSAVPADGYRGTSTTGAVSVIDTADPAAPVGSIAVGLHPTAMYVQGKALFVANTFSDTVSVINTKKDKVVQTIATDPWPSSDTGYAPTGLTMGPGNHLLVTLGRANAVAVYKYNDKPQQPVNYIGLLPTDYYPMDRRDRSGARSSSPTRAASTPAARRCPSTRARARRSPTGHGTHSTTASLTRFTLPRDKDIAQTYTDTVFAQNGWAKGDVQQAKGRKAAAGRGPGPRRRPLHDQARVPAGQGEPHLRPDLRRHERRATATRRSRSSARGSRPTSTRSPGSSGCTTTPTTSAPTRPRATTG